MRRLAGALTLGLLLLSSAVPTIGGTTAPARHPVDGAALSHLSARVTPSGEQEDDWPMFMHDISHSSHQGFAGPLNATSARNLTLLWSYPTRTQIVSEPTVVGKSVYFGSWDGYERALYASNGTLQWATYTGRSACLPHTHPVGVTSTSALVGGALYLGGGKDYWYALSPSNGSVLWKIYTGNSNATVGGGHYNWASPLVYGGFAYVGLASHCDLPLVQGQLLKVSLANHSVVQVYNTTDPSNLGAAIWSSPAMNPSTGTIYFATGNLAVGNNTTLDDSIVMVNASRMQYVDHFQVPFPQRIPDGDFGASVTLYKDVNGTPMVADIDKNGVLFGLRQSNLSLGAVWQTKVAYNETFSSAAFAGGNLYVGSSESYLANGKFVRGSLRSVNGTTGHVNWILPLAGRITGPVAVSNNLVVATAGADLVVARSSTGQKLFDYHSGNLFWGGPTIGEGQIFAGNNNGTLFAFGVRPTPLIRANATAGPHPLKVAFSGIQPGGGQGVTFAWNFGDGNNSTRQNVVHTFTYAGTFTVTLTVTNSAGAVGTTFVTVVVTDLPFGPDRRSRMRRY